jgi:hypothetical protein
MALPSKLYEYVRADEEMAEIFRQYSLTHDIVEVGQPRSFILIDSMASYVLEDDTPNVFFDVLKGHVRNEIAADEGACSSVDGFNVALKPLAGVHEGYLQCEVCKGPLIISMWQRLMSPWQEVLMCSFCAKEFANKEKGKPKRKKVDSRWIRIQGSMPLFTSIGGKTVWIADMFQ